MNYHQKPFTYINQVHLFVQDLNSSLSYYQDILGFQVLEKKENQVSLTVDGVHPLVILETKLGMQRKEPKKTGLFHFAILLPSRKDLANIWIHLIQTGNAPSGASDHDVSEALYFSDPDGHGIEIYADKPSDTWVWNSGQVKMGTTYIDAEGVLAENDGKLFTKLPKETVLGHIHLHVSDLGKAEEFYTKGLGFEVVTAYGGQALFLSTGKYHHHIGMNIWNGVDIPVPDEHHVHMGYYAIRYPSAEERNKAVKRIQELGYEAKEESQYIETKDPSGTVIRLTV